jgi:hypothetical protein
MVGYVEEVHRMVWMYRLRWLEARLKKLGGVGDFDLEAHQENQKKTYSGLILT